MISRITITKKLVPSRWLFWAIVPTGRWNGIHEKMFKRYMKLNHNCTMTYMYILCSNSILIKFIVKRSTISGLVKGFRSYPTCKLTWYLWNSWIRAGKKYRKTSRVSAYLYWLPCLQCPWSDSMGPRAAPTFLGVSE